MRALRPWTAALFLLVIGCSKEAPVPEPPPWRAAAEAWEPGEPIPDFELIDQAGARFRLSDLGQSWVLISFVFTRCTVPTACPETMRRMGEIHATWSARPPGKRGAGLRLLTLTLDPAHDTPSVLAAYGRAHGVSQPLWTLATGEEELLGNLLPAMFNVLATPDATLGVNHSVKAALLAPGLLPVREWKDNEITPGDILTAMSERPQGAR